MNEMMNRKNIVFIGMAACGKSTIGALVAKALDMTFIDTDLTIQQEYGMPLWQILEEFGSTEFINRESKVICSLDCTNACISTGGSAVYSEQAMSYLKQTSEVVFIHLSYPSIEQRLAATDIPSRGIVIEEGRTLLDVYNERTPLYSKYADYTIEADGKAVEELVLEICSLFTQGTSKASNGK